PAGQALLVLDDYHLIGAAHVHAAVQFLLGHLPPASPGAGHPRRPAAAAEPAARPREFTELRVGDLRFTAPAAAGTLREAVRPADSGAALARSTVPPQPASRPAGQGASWPRGPPTPPAEWRRGT